MRLFDEVNDLSESNILSIDDYFDEIEELTEEEKEKRKKFAFEMEDILLFIFVLFQTMRDYNYINEEYIKAQLQSRYLELVRKYGVDIDFDVSEYIKQFSQDTVDTTLRNGDTPYFTSDDRAILIAENESQNTFNRQDYIGAIKAGKTRKQWVDIRDKRERETHREVGGTIIPIEDYFLVGDSLLLYPHDYSMNPEEKETVNCRCGIRYI